MFGELADTSNTDPTRRKTSTNTRTRKILSQDGACNAVLSYLRHYKSNEVIVQAGLAAMKNLSCDEKQGKGETHQYILCFLTQQN